MGWPSPSPAALGGSMEMNWEKKLERERYSRERETLREYDIDGIGTNLTSTSFLSCFLFLFPSLICVKICY